MLHNNNYRAHVFIGGYDLTETLPSKQGPVLF